MTDSAPWRDGEHLRRLYIDEGLSKEEIASRWGCSERTVYRWLKKALSGTRYGHDCPECGETFPTDRGVRQHYGQTHEGSIAGHPVECGNCETVVRLPEYRIERYDVNYCSDECRFEGMRDPVVEVSCCVCDTKFDRKEWHAEQSNRHVCSDSCRTELYTGIVGDDHPAYKPRVEHTCSWCDSTIMLRQSYPDVEHTFCRDSDCRSKWVTENRSGPLSPIWEGGETDYGVGWSEAKKERVRERDDRKCQQCGRTEEDHLELFGSKHPVHHIQKARSFTDAEKRNHEDNLVTLCRGGCHQLWEKMSPLRPVVVPGKNSY